MDTNLLKEFNKFCNTTAFKIKFALLGIACLVIGFLTIHDQNTEVPYFTFGCIACCILMFGVILFKTVKQKRYVAQLEHNGKMEAVLQDFADAAPYFDGKMKLGRLHVYCKNNCPVSYDEIGKVYQHVKKTNGVETDRFLVLEDDAEKRISRVKMKLAGKADMEVAIIMSCLKNENPRIHLGYR